MSELLQRISYLMSHPIEISTMLLSVSHARSLYTYDGVMKQLELFFHDPFSDEGGYLRCSSGKKLFLVSVMNEMEAYMNT